MILINVKTYCNHFIEFYLDSVLNSQLQTYPILTNEAEALRRSCFSFIIAVHIKTIFFALQKGLKNVFDEAILAALEPPEQKKGRKCRIL